MRQRQFKFLRTGLLVITLAAGAFACQKSPETVQAGNTSHDVLLSPADRNFMKNAEDSDIKLRNLARVMMQRSDNEDVRNYAKMLDKDHTNDLRNAIELMESKGIHQPQNLPEVKHEALTELNKLSGPALDRAFIDTMVQDHQKAVAEYTKEVQSGEDPAVRDYAARTLETLQKHLQKAQELQRKLNQSSP
jgi:putative membrane protein